MPGPLITGPNSMSRLFASLLIVFFAVTSMTACAQSQTWSDEAPFASENERYDHLEYFGFYASAMAGWNFTEALAPYTNLTWIHVGSVDDRTAAVNEIIKRVGEARDADVEATLSIEPFVFIRGTGQLKSDQQIEDFLIELRARLEVEDLFDAVAMIYPKDEPFRELVRERDPNFFEKYISGEIYEEIHRDLVHLNSLIKLVFPEVPIGAILSGHELHHFFFSIPENYDWIGFDCYDDLFRGCADRSFIEHYTHLLEFMQPHQRLIAVPETWALNETLSRSDWPEILGQRLRHHYEIALNEPRFVAFIPFIWSFDADGETPGLGLNRFPELYDDGVNNAGTVFVDQVVDLGQQIKHRQYRFPDMAHQETEESPYRPQSDIQSEIISISEQGMVSAWALDTALPHKNLRVQIRVRDATGTLLYKTRTERTFVRNPAAAPWRPLEESLIGLHGYWVQLPLHIVDQSRRQSLDVELVTFADGLQRDTGPVVTLLLDSRLKLPRPIIESNEFRSAPQGSTEGRTVGDRSRH